MWCSLCNLILPVGIAIAIGLKVLLLMLQDFSPIELDENAISLIIFLPFLVVLCAWIVPFVVWQIARRKHSFIDETAKNAFNFTLIITGIWLCFLLPAISFAVFLALDYLKIKSMIDYATDLFLAILILHVTAILYGSDLARKGKVHKYPFAFGRKILIICSTIVISIIGFLSPLIYLFNPLSNDDKQRLGQIKFDSSRWQNSSLDKSKQIDIRARMLGDLYRNFSFNGRTSDDAIEILGKPDLEEKANTRNSTQQTQNFCYHVNNRGMRDTIIEDYLTFQVDRSGKIIDSSITTRVYDAGMYPANKEYKDSVDRIPCGTAKNR
jgi:uncharacterized Tic20 family protein